MNILQSTFDKHKKLVLENLGVISEVEVYHATTKEKAEKIRVDGPDLSLAGQNFNNAGAQQGAGFYFYKNKKIALNHAAENKGEVVLVFDQDINSEVFDIDYEGDYNLAGKYLQDNADFVEAHKKELSIKNLIKDASGKLLSISVTVGNRYGGIPLQDDDVNIDMANKMAYVFQKLEKLDKSKFDAFEKAALKISNTLKYNGKEKIYPVRIEDLQGNILWKADK
jgi:hypothetical protein